MADKIKLYLSLIIIITSLGLFYTYSEYSILYRTLAMIVVFAVAVFIASKTEWGSELISFLRLSTVEMKKIVWPSKKETTQTTMIVGVMVLIIGIMLWIFDQFIGWGVRYLTGQG
ncbi:MAG: preprotein translocase subunit SecE [Pseudomonadota bacterium]